jgi:hypothetical protein
MGCCVFVLEDDPNPRYPVEEGAVAVKKDEDDLAVTASCASFDQRLTTSFAEEKRWYADTRAADEMEGFRSTSAALKKRSTPCAMEG